MKKIINFIDEVEKEYNAALKEYKDSCLRGEFIISVTTGNCSPIN